MVQALHLDKRVSDPLDHSLRGIRALGTRETGIPCGVHADREQLDEIAGDARVGRQRGLDVVLGEGRLSLAQVLGQRSKDEDLPPGQPRLQDEGVETVGLGATPPDRAERLLEARPAVLAFGALAPQRGRRGPQPEVIDVHPGTIGPVQDVGTLVGDLDPHVGEDRKHPGQRERTARVELEAALVARPARLGIHVELDGVVGAEDLDPTDVRDGNPGGEVLFVGLGEGFAVERCEPGAELLAVLGAGALQEVLVPRAGGVDDLGLQRRSVDVLHLGALGHPQNEVHLGQRRLGHPGRVVDAVGGERLAQQRFHAQPDRRVVAVPREVDQR
ncbi:MAG: hypothetical protein BWY91_02006 [bacterium ADurb.BinA028]|nr:MAG: hypothetical protein BWY91_02006 [bacterium ADurb.BinA028]